MKQLFLMVALCLMSLSATFAQIQGEPITLKKTFGGDLIYQGERRLTIRQALDAMKPNETAYRQMKKAQSSNAVAAIFGATGGFMVGWQLGAAAAGDDANWAVAGIGAGLVAISIPFMVATTKHSRAAIETYNNDLAAQTRQSQLQFNLQFSGDGLGLVMTF